MDSTTLATGAGPLSVIVHKDGAVAAAGFCSVADLETRLREHSRARPELGGVTRALVSYLDGDLAAIDQLQVRQPGSEHQQQVWRALRGVPAGSTVSYGELARRLGRSPGAARAIGSACGANLVAPIVPCHRVTRAGGHLGGYYYGLTVKEWLLAHEGHSAPALAMLAPPSTMSPAGSGA